MPRHINAAGLALIKESEGCRLEAYKDAVGVWTIGYGSTGPHASPGNRITAEEAEALLLKDLARFESGIELMVEVPLTDNQFAALVSWAFNVGLGAVRDSTLLRLLNEGEYAAVPVELQRWNKAGGRVLAGLTKRRQREAALWSTEPAPEAGFSLKETVMETKPFWASRTLWVNALALVASVGGAFGLDLGLDAETQTAIVGGILAVVNIILRLVTKAPVAAK